MIGYLGPVGTFSHLAATEYAGSEDTKAYRTIYEVIEAVGRGEIDRGIVPMENSVEGSITVTLDALAYDFDLYIVDEYVLKIQQNLMVRPGTKLGDIREVMSHDSAIGQCAKMLKSEFENVHIKRVESTSFAAKMASESDGTIAALCAENCADIYGLDILKHNCNDEDTNSTRFVVLAKEPNRSVTTHDKSSIVFTLDHKPGTLYSALSLFEQSGINLLKIESRPLKTELGKYIFFIDIEGNMDSPTIYFALDRVRQSTLFYKFLGSYPCRTV